MRVAVQTVNEDTFFPNLTCVVFKVQFKVHVHKLL